MRRHLRLLVVAHLDSESRGDRGDAPPLSRTAAPACIEIAYVDSARHHQVATARTTDLALSCANRDAGLTSHRGHIQPVVRPVHRLLEPANVEALNLAGEGHRFAEAPALVGVDRQHEVAARRLPRDTNALRVLLRCPASNFELAPSVAGRPYLLHFPTEISERLV